MARVLSINSGNIIEHAYKIQKLDREVDVNYRNILVKSFEETENNRELILMKDTVEAFEGMADKSQDFPFIHNI
jgi:uncharacterized protein Yka (UPF0111/DUF47 family)